MSHPSTDSELESPRESGTRQDAPPLYPHIGIISLSVDPWGWRWNSRHQVLTRVAEYFRVLWLDPAAEWRTAVRSGIVTARETTPQGQLPSFTVRVSASWLPVIYRPAWLGGALFRARIAAARDSLRRQGCRRIVLYIWHPQLVAALDAVPYDLSVYHIYDDHSRSDTVDPQLDPDEARLVRRAQLLFTVSRPMFEWKGALNVHSHLLSNGVDFAAFADPVPVPEDLARVPEPRLGYAGFLKTQLDWDLLLSLATRHPEWSFVLVGARRVQPELAAQISRLEETPNVYFLGPKSTVELSHYAQHFDVCLMPYRMNSYATFTYPLKLNEYLAGGRPVVSVPLPALEEADGLVGIASTISEWDDALTRALEPAANAPALRLARQAEARRHDWSVIVKQVADAIVEALGDARDGRRGGQRD
ncbi:MAG: glycosyltransferase [Gemmatimonadaceae bacterium]